MGVKPLSCSRSLIHSAYVSAESIATPPDSDLEDELLRKMLASPLYTEVSVKLDAESVQKREDPANVGKSLLDGNRDHLLNQARSELMKQEHQVGSLKDCVEELQQKTHAQRLESQDAHHGYAESRREQSRLQEELVMKEKALRDSQIRNIHEMEEMKRAQELRVDEVAVQRSRENHEEIQRLTSQMPEIQDQMNSMNDLGEFQEVESNHGGRLSYVPSQPATLPSYRSMLSRDKRLPLDTWNASGPQENVFGNHFLRLIRHSTTPSATGSVTGRLVARDEDRNKGTSPMPTFARRPSTMSLLFPVDIPKKSMVGQQRQQISEV